ncbi:hypothetical protein [Thermocrinis sp.]|uniref:hypothetical protein n=1 Tax=Thermocrinis sp. TaxID=2024383 RepID=UPI002FDD8CF0
MIETYERMQNLTRWILLSVFSLLLGFGKAFASENVGAMLKAMVDPAGAPFYPVVFQVLQVLTWALHILFVWTSVGGLYFTIYGFTRSDENWQRLAKATLELSKVSVSLAIVLGVAPLLFYQVIYDPLWYSSANLSGSWYMLFIVFLLIGYYLIWGAYFTKNNSKASMLFSIGGVVFLLFVGFLIHVFNYQSLYPEKWVEWYTGGGSTMRHDGFGIYAFNLFRYLSLLVFPAGAVTGVFLMLYGWYFKDREDMNRSYLEWASKVGAKSALVFGVPWIISHILYILSTPSSWKAGISNPLALLSIVTLLVCAGIILLAQKDPIKMAVPSLLGGVIGTLGVAIYREYLRVASTAQFGYSIYDYKLNVEWLSPMLFLGTTLTGLILYAYAWWMAYRAGRTSQGKVYQASEAEHNLGTLSVFVVILWAIVFIGVGIIWIIRNYT